MSLAYFPMYPDDFEADTAHLTLAEDGAYNRLLRLCWRTPGCNIPADREWIYRRLRALSDDDRAVVDTVLDEFFTIESGRYFSLSLAEWLETQRTAAPRPWIPLAVQRFVHERDGRECAYCGSGEGPFHLDHIFPWALGGEHSPENLTVCCAQCNWSKGAKTLAEWRGF